MFLAKDTKISNLTSAAKPQRTTATQTDKELKDQASSSPVKRPYKIASPRNDTLPTEILMLIFEILIAISYEPSPKVVEILSLVCRSWQRASRGMELLRIPISTSQAIAALLEHIRTTPLFQAQNRANIRILEVKCDEEEELHRVDEVLPLCRTSLQRLVLCRDIMNTNTSNANLLQNRKQEAGDVFYFPNVTHLCLFKFSAQELWNFITSVDPTKLELLHMRDTFFRYDYNIPERLDSLRFPRLKVIRIDVCCRNENPTIPWLFRVAPNLEMLVLSIRRRALRMLTQYMGDEEILRRLETLHLFVQLNMNDYLDFEGEDLAPLVALTKRRGWKNLIGGYWDHDAPFLSEKAKGAGTCGTYSIGTIEEACTASHPNKYERLAPTTTFRACGPSALCPHNTPGNFKDMFIRAKNKIRGLVSGTKPQKTTAAKNDKEPKDHASSPPLRRPFKLPTSPQNDTLPAEVLIDIFDALISISYDPSPKVIETLSLVCRSWQNAGRGMELLRISISTSQTIDALLEYIHTTPLFRTQNRAKIRMLSVECRYQEQLHRMEELLPLCRTSLQKLVLGRYDGNTLNADLLQNAKQEAGEDFYFPNLTYLGLIKLGPQELYNFVTAVDPSRLEYLRIWDTFFWYDYDIPEELDNLRFPFLKEIRIDGYCRDENPTTPWLIRVAPNLEMLELSIRRPSLRTFTRRMSDEEILRSLKTLKLWIRIDKYDDLDPKSEDLAPLVAVIKRRGWKQRICVHMSCGSWRVLLPTGEFKALINNLNVGSTNDRLVLTSM
ncbi:hypothetical protein FRB90_012295 [Tulasnella sp. 427]|nr:hypothetical protein FRB90_012295 [Tulasnella sp. 427]